MRVGYFCNQYPGISHTFIRREIHALERLGVNVRRYAIRRVESLVDERDRAEARQTRYILEIGLLRCIGLLILASVRQPVDMFRVIRIACQIGWRSDRGLVRHMAYVAEAAVLARWCRLDSIQHIHAHFGTNSAAVAMLASRLSGIPYSFTAHGPDEFEKAEWLALDVKLQHAAFVVCVSSFGKSQLMRWSPPDYWAKIVEIHCGLDEEFLAATPSPPKDTRRLVCVGRIAVQKAQLVLVEAARALDDAGVACEIVFVGDGPMRPEVERAIKAAGLERRLKILGWGAGDLVKSEIAAARALVLPSFAENLPVVIMEAFALGRPVISTFVAGIPELVEPGTNGWLVPAGDEFALAAAIRQALETPIERIAAMGQAGRSRVLAAHDCRQEAEKLKLLFEQVCLQEAGAGASEIAARTPLPSPSPICRKEFSKAGEQQNV